LGAGGRIRGRDLFVKRVAATKGDAVHVDQQGAASINSQVVRVIVIVLFSLLIRIY